MSDQRPIDSLRLHPEAEKVPRPDSADRRTLRDSLRDDGQQDPIDITADDLILDGRTRWDLLRELGAQTIQVRVVDMPEAQQPHYIIERALTRRNLTSAQKRVLNDLLRTQVVEVAVQPSTGEEVRIGLGQSQRAEALGVGRMTVRDWDEAGDGARNRTPSNPPTHFRRSDGKVQPLHPNRTPRDPAVPRPAKASDKPPALKVASKNQRTSPPWLWHYTKWCRAVLPEDRPHLLRMSAELHKALALIGLSCDEGGTTNGAQDD